MQDKIMKELQSSGLLARAVPVSHLSELKAELDNRYKDGLIASGLYEYLMGFYSFEAPENMQSVLSVASPVPGGRLTFTLGDKKIETIIPPTYMEFGKLQPQIEEQLNNLLTKYGYHAENCCTLPQKLTAAHSGLARYGRNNVCYVEGAGSFVLLSTYFTDMPCEEDPWQPARRMDCCKACTICLDRCPTGAISGSRDVIDASRCLTNLNENADVPFPGWLSPAVHHCIVGCMRCQETCPMDVKFMNRVVETFDFTEEETELVMANGDYDSLPTTLKDKLENLGLKSYYRAMPRNLQMLINKDCMQQTITAAI